MLFADDNLLFFENSHESTEQIKEVLRCYCQSAGQLINEEKCSLFFNANTAENMMEEVRECLGVPVCTFEAKYLGLPTPEGCLEKEKFQPITDRLAKRCSAWDEKLMSAGAKEVLIKSVAQALPTYIISVFHLSASVCNGLPRGIQNYWWGATEGQRKTHWIAWKKFTRGKLKGGLGFRDLKLFNQALLARQAWRLVDNSDSLCAQVLKGKYYPHGDLLDTAFPANQSQTWRAISHGLELLKKGIIWRVGDGQKIRIWRSPWLPCSWALHTLGKAAPNRLN